VEFSWSIFLIGLLLGIFQLAVGVVIGRALPLKQARSSRPEPPKAARLFKLTNRLHRLITTLANDVGRHQVRIEQMTKDLSLLQRNAGDRLNHVVLQSVARITQINHRLQSRLSAAEHKLQQQAQQIESHLCRAQTAPSAARADLETSEDEPTLPNSRCAADLAPRPGADGSDPGGAEASSDAEMDQISRELRMRLAEMSRE